MPMAKTKHRSASPFVRRTLLNQFVVNSRAFVSNLLYLSSCPHSELEPGVFTQNSYTSERERYRLRHRLFCGRPTYHPKGNIGEGWIFVNTKVPVFLIMPYCWTGYSSCMGPSPMLRVPKAYRSNENRGSAPTPSAWAPTLLLYFVTTEQLSSLAGP